MDDPRPQPTQGWTAKRERRKDLFKTVALSAVACAIVLGVAYSAKKHKPKPTEIALLTETSQRRFRLLTTFHGFPCTSDCSGHIAGYRWAQRHSIDDEDDCSGKSKSFIEGCMVYVAENSPQDDESWDECSGPGRPSRYADC